MNDSPRSTAPVAVIGAGPIGLAAAAHLAQRELPFELFEAGERVAEHLAAYAHVRLFSPWRFNIDRAARAMLEAAGWRSPADEAALPTAGELVAGYLQPLAQLPAMSRRLHLGTRVEAVARAGLHKGLTAGRERAGFVLRLRTRDGLQERRARAVIDATGTWGQPKPIGVHGLAALGEVEARAHISYGMPDILGRDRGRFAGRAVLVVGAGHSAAGNLLALATLAEEVPGTRIVWAVRGHDLRRLFGGGERDGLPARGELGARLRRLVELGRLEVRLGFGVREIAREISAPRPRASAPHSGVQLTVHADDASLPPISGIDEIVAATGSRPDLALTRELRLRWDAALECAEALAPLIDPNVHSCGTVRAHGHRELRHPETDFYVIGAKSYGRAPNFLMATGYEQARSVVAAVAGDWQAADQVQLDLPETGVCSSDLSGSGFSGTGAACCGGPPKADASACCVLDERKKAKGEAGCGCAAGAAAAGEAGTA
jgi:hypothetical protein